MSNKLHSAIAVASALFFTLGLSAARAADAGFCDQYARAALVQVRGGLANPGCAGGMGGPRWSSDYHVHYDWCRGASFAATGTERDARTAFLRACTGR
jgi:hypothetical protein